MKKIEEALAALARTLEARISEAEGRLLVAGFSEAGLAEFVAEQRAHSAVMLREAETFWRQALARSEASGTAGPVSFTFDMPPSNAPPPCGSMH